MNTTNIVFIVWIKNTAIKDPIISASGYLTAPILLIPSYEDTKLTLAVKDLMLALPTSHVVLVIDHTVGKIDNSLFFYT